MAGNQKYNIEDIAGKGQGMLATAAIARGELIIAEHTLLDSQIGPDVLYNPKTFFDAAGTHNGLTVLSAKYNMLTPEQQAVVLSLHNQYQEQPPHQNLLGIFSTNAFQRSVQFDGVEHTILYICSTICRVNHSCRPNAVVNPNPLLGQVTLYATEAIPAGTEITVDYIANINDFLTPCRPRREDLRRHYGFECKCEVCRLPAKRVTPISKLRSDTAKLFSSIKEPLQLRGLVNLSAHARHKPEVISNIRSYIENLTTLGARDGKLKDAYMTRSEFHETYAAHANINSIGRRCTTCRFPIHPAVHLDLAIEAVREAIKIGTRCWGSVDAEVRECQAKLQQLCEQRAAVPTSPPPSP
ncbi:hypothetical protein LTR27_002998 [Elasticomyces elasticus]|nr:hypothetical protein LTR27_002998 [Elasticomyces elasticus]